MNIVYIKDYLAANDDECEEYIDEDLRHYDDGERCICWDCDAARRCPTEPDWKSLPLFKDYVH